MIFERATGIGVEKDPYFPRGNLLIKRGDVYIQSIEFELDALLELRDRLNEVIPLIQDELAAEVESEARDLNEAEQRFVEQRETELEVRYDREHPYDP